MAKFKVVFTRTVEVEADNKIDAMIKAETAKTISEEKSLISCDELSQKQIFFLKKYLNYDDNRILLISKDEAIKIIGDKIKEFEKNRQLQKQPQRKQESFGGFGDDPYDDDYQDLYGEDEPF